MLILNFTILYFNNFKITNDQRLGFSNNCMLILLPNKLAKANYIFVTLLVLCWCLFLCVSLYKFCTENIVNASNAIA